MSGCVCCCIIFVCIKLLHRSCSIYLTSLNDAGLAKRLGAAAVQRINRADSENKLFFWFSDKKRHSIVA